MRQPRIGFDYRPALLGRSGIPRAVRELARALAATGRVDLRLFGHSWARPLVSATAPAGAHLCRTRLPGRALPALARLGIGAERMCGGAALFHWTDYVHPPVGPRARVVMTLHDCAFAVEPEWHGVSAPELASRTRAAAARADAIVCPTRATAGDARRHLGVAEERLRVIPFGADHELPPPGPPPFDGRPYVLMLGTIEPRKNHVRALRAWQALGAGRPRLVVAGRPGWCCDEAVRAIESCRDGVVWERDGDDRRLATLLAHARALLYPSLLEGFGFPPLEALAHGLPVVHGDHAALRETIGEVGFECDPRDVASIAHALDRALRSDDDAARAARRAQAARFRWADCATAHVDLYAEVLGR